jgi:hypothetical protein
MRTITSLGIASVAVLAACATTSDDADSADSNLNATTPAPANVAHGEQVVRTKGLHTPFAKVEDYKKFWTVWEDQSEQDAVKDLQGAALIAAVAKHYGLYPADYDNNDLPLGLMQVMVPNESGTPEPWAEPNCYACHATRINDKMIFGASNARFDFHMMVVDNLRMVEKATNIPKDTLVNQLPVQVNQVAGGINVIQYMSVSASIRDANANLRSPVDFDKVLALVPNDIGPNPWWNSARKDRFFWDGWMSSAAELHSADAMQLVVRFGGGNTGIPEVTVANTAQQIMDSRQDLADSYAYHMGTPTPAYPFPIDQTLAQEGETIFETKALTNGDTCKDCHGSYAASATPPPKHNTFVAPAQVGTDPTRFTNVPQVFLDWYKNGVQSTLISKTDSSGQPARVNVAQQRGYIAPPLNGVWASAPYFHNNSVPTLAEVLQPSARPAIWKLVDDSADMYDPQRVGLKVERPDAVPPNLSQYQTRKYHDSTNPKITGASPKGHDYPSALSDHERSAVLEYLKTL